jgi:hypothetical protein
MFFLYRIFLPKTNGSTGFCRACLIFLDGPDQPKHFFNWIVVPVPITRTLDPVLITFIRQWKIPGFSLLIGKGSISPNLYGNTPIIEAYYIGSKLKFKMVNEGPSIQCEELHDS